MARVHALAHGLQDVCLHALARLGGSCANLRARLLGRAQHDCIPPSLIFFYGLLIARHSLTPSHRSYIIRAEPPKGRYTDDYAADAAYDFYRGEIDLKAFALDIYEHPQGWRFWWNNENRTDIVAACHTFDYKRLAVAV